MITAAKPQTKYLGKTVTKADALDLIPWTGDPIRIVLHATEFSSFCPVTKMPDYAKLKIEYVPHKHIAETKSVKLVLQSYRDRAQFNEKLVDELQKQFASQLKPKWLQVTGEFNIRGGIYVEAISEYRATFVKPMSEK